MVLQQKKKLNKYTGFNLILIRYENDFENTIKKINKLQSAKMPSGCISLNWLICWNKTKRNNKKKKLFIVRFICCLIQPPNLIASKIVRRTKIKHKVLWSNHTNFCNHSLNRKIVQ